VLAEAATLDGTQQLDVLRLVEVVEALPGIGVLRANVVGESPEFFVVLEDLLMGLDERWVVVLLQSGVSGHLPCPWRFEGGRRYLA